MSGERQVDLVAALRASVEEARARGVQRQTEERREHRPGCDLKCRESDDGFCMCWCHR